MSAQRRRLWNKKQSTTCPAHGQSTFVTAMEAALELSACLIRFAEISPSVSWSTSNDHPVLSSSHSPVWLILVRGRTFQEHCHYPLSPAQSQHNYISPLYSWVFIWKSPPIHLNSVLFDGKAILSGVRNYSGCSRVHSFNPTKHRKNECTTDVHSTARESP